MTREIIVCGIINLIRNKAKDLGLTVVNKGTGHAFDNTFWKNVFEDNSGIPNIVAISADGSYTIELRSFWGAPELSVRRKTKDGEDLLIAQYSDYKKINDEYQHTKDYTVSEVRVDGHGNYRDLINEVYEMIDYVNAETYRTMLTDEDIEVLTQVERKLKSGELWFSTKFTCHVFKDEVKALVSILKKLEIDDYAASIDQFYELERAAVKEAGVSSKSSCPRKKREPEWYALRDAYLVYDRTLLKRISESFDEISKKLQVSDINEIKEEKTA